MPSTVLASLANDRIHILVSVLGPCKMHVDEVHESTGLGLVIRMSQLDSPHFLVPSVIDWLGNLRH
jgi:hypothetical protein